MFEILRALKALSEVAGGRTRWRIDDELILRVEIPLTAEEAEFVGQMQALFAPADPATDATYLAGEAVRDADDLLAEASRMDVDLRRRRGVDVIKQLQKASEREGVPEALLQQVHQKKSRLAYVIFDVPETPDQKEH